MVQWATIPPSAWHDSIANEDSIFRSTYAITREEIEGALKAEPFDVVIEVGCGTGDILGPLRTTLPRYGLDINLEFLSYCREHYPDVLFEELEATSQLDAWWKKLNESREKPFLKPLLICVNNTLNIMPRDIRGQMIEQMQIVAGSEGKCVCSYWNGHFFSHAICNYYQANPELCGHFDVHKHVDWDTGILQTPTGYSTHWMLPEGVQKQLRAFDVDLTLHKDEDARPDELQDGIYMKGLAIFIWFSEESCSQAKRYYDSDDAQRFYHGIWGKETVHIGRHDLLTMHDRQNLSRAQQIARAQVLHEEKFIQIVQEKVCSTNHHRVRVLDMGCGYGGLLRRMYEADMVWSAVGCDISTRMCAQARRLNAEIDAENVIDIKEESYLDVSVPDESMDLVISMDALLHVGPERQKRVMQEASRVLRPGGWIIFTDIMQKEEVNATEMRAIYDRIHLSKMGTVNNYREALLDVGITKFDFTPQSSNVSKHYDAVREVLKEKGQDIGLSDEYSHKMEQGLTSWVDLGPENIEWGYMMAQKTEKAPSRSSSSSSMAVVATAAEEMRSQQQPTLVRSN